MSNFDFLKDFDSTLWKLGSRIERQVNTSPSGVKADATTFLEHILKELLSQAGLKYNSRKPFTDQVDAVFRSELKMSNAYRERIKNAYNYRNKIHDEFDEIEKHEFEDAVQLHEKLFYIARKFYRDYNDDYDEYKGVPDFRPLDLDFSDDEIELVKLKDFNEIVDVKYDYCVVCGEPNHLNHSIYCHECSRKLDNSNNFISIRNAFGKDAKFTKEDLIEFGMPEGYVNQFINSMVREDMLKVSGRFITFRNMNLDEYLKRIDDYIAVGELITRFKEDKISPSDIRMSREYRLGKIKQEPFYQFYKIVKREIIKKFEKDLLATGDVWKSIDYTTITDKELKRWYDINLSNHRKGQFNESFNVFNDLMIGEYLSLKSEGIFDGEIRETLSITDETYDFWCEYDGEFEARLKKIKIDLIVKAYDEDKSKAEIIEFAGLTEKEYDDIVKYSEFKGDEFSKIRNRELESRKKKLIECLKHNDLQTSLEMAKISPDDFYDIYEKDMSGEFYQNATRILMHNFLNQRRKGKTKSEAAEAIAIEYRYVEHWFKRTLDICEEFKNRHVRVIVDLIYDGFKRGLSKQEISLKADVNVNRINSYLNLGQRGYGTYKRLYDYYAENVLPKQLSGFLDEIKNKSFKKALELSELTEEEFEYCYQQGKEANPDFSQFYHDYMNIRLERYMSNIKKGKAPKKALRNSGLTAGEVDECYRLGRDGDEHFRKFFEDMRNFRLNIYIASVIDGDDKAKALEKSRLSEAELRDDIDNIILYHRMILVSNALRRDLTTKQAAKKANVDAQTVYEWFLKGREGDERFEKFSQVYYDGYVAPGAEAVQMALNKGMSKKEILSKFKKHFTVEDYEFWQDNGFLDEAREKIESEDEGDE